MPSPEPKRRFVALRLPEPMSQALDQLAARDFTNVAEVMRRALLAELRGAGMMPGPTRSSTERRP